MSKIYVKGSVPWSHQVRARDNWRCRLCGSSQFIQAHHIYNRRDHPDKILDINNGITLCPKCHNKSEPGTKYYDGSITIEFLQKLVENSLNSGETHKGMGNPDPSKDSDILEGATTRRIALTNCIFCNKEILRPISRLIKSFGRNYCNQQCFFKDISRKDKFYCLYCNKDISSSGKTSPKYCSNSCQLKYEYKTGQRNKLPPRWSKFIGQHEWSIKYDKCITCGLTDNKYRSIGMCTKCYNKIHNAKKVKSPTKKLHSKE